MGRADARRSAKMEDGGCFSALFPPPSALLSCPLGSPSPCVRRPPLWVWGWATNGIFASRDREWDLALVAGAERRGAADLPGVQAFRVAVAKCVSGRQCCPQTAQSARLTCQITAFPLE